MRKLLLAVAGFIPVFIYAQNIRTYDGSNNNLRYPNWGATHTVLPRIAAPSYGDGANAPREVDFLPRAISNLVMDQPAQMRLDDTITNLNDYLWVFGQFIDHDIILTESGQEIFCTDVPAGDTFFDPFNTGEREMCINRSLVMEGTGESEDNPREHFNGITAWIDGSAVYGSDEHAANWLRSFEDGKLKVSEGDMMPWNTIDGELNSPVDPDAPHVADDTGRNDKLMVAGDIRANENIMLACLHNIFVREHNRLCDELKEEHPEWDDEQLYQYARKMVGGFIQNITFNEWLPATGIELPTYSGYNPNLDPSITNEFSAFAFRIGHTLVNSRVMRLDPETGDVAPGGHLDLRNAFFNPRQMAADGLCMYIKGATKQRMQFFDRMVISDLRNFLFGPPGSGGMDLATTNIMRARERGIPDLNTIRENLGLPRYASFNEINSELETVEKLLEMYENVDAIDPWVGILAEEPVKGGVFGETTVEILLRQFLALRDGDRFYFQIDPVLSLEDKREILNTKLADVLMRNSCMDNMLENVMFYDSSGFVNNEELLVSSEMQVYPNPIYDQFEMSFESKVSAEGTLIVRDELGRMVYQQNVQVKTGINTLQAALRPDLASGVYFASLQADGEQFTARLLKTNI